MLRMTRIMMACAAVSISLGGFGCASEHSKMTLHDAPASVQSSLKKLTGDAAVTELTKETEDGKVIFEAEYMVGTANHTVSLNESGVVLEDEEEIKTTDLPAVVLTAINTAIRGGTC